MELRSVAASGEFPMFLARARLRTVRRAVDPPRMASARLLPSGQYHLTEGHAMIVLGIILLVIGLIAKIGILTTIGIIVLVIGAVLAIAGTAGREIGGRKHWY